MLSETEVVIRLLAAALFGGAIGFERERLSWAGLRTHMLVCVGAALFMIVSIEGFGDALHHPNVSLDPSRVAAPVASGQIGRESGGERVCPYVELSVVSVYLKKNNIGQ